MGERRIKQVTVEFYPRDMRNVGYYDLIEDIDKVTVLSPISLMPEKTALLAIVKWNGKENTEKWERSPLIDQVIDMGSVKGGKLYMFLGKEEPWFFKMIQMIMEEMRVFFNWPVILEPDRIQIRWIGYLEDISMVMKLFEEFQMEETITSIVNYDPSVSRSLEGLTTRQYAFLLEAYDSGFFEDRRAVSIKDLSRKYGISSSSYMLTLRRALRNLIKGALEVH